MKDLTMENNPAVFETAVPGLPPPRRGKVRDVYDLGDKLLLVATDRISAFDVVFPTPIPDKGKILTGLTLFWLDLLKDVVPNHLLPDPLESLDLPEGELALLRGRSLLVKKAEVIPFECIVRGYISGSAWNDYRRTGSLSGIGLPAGLKTADKLPETVFTPSTKAEVGHDESVPIGFMVDRIGRDLAEKVRAASLALYAKAASYACGKGIIIADTKFEFGLMGGELTLIDEVLTPDSSRFWPAAEWEPGRNPPSFDKQYLRDWLEKECCWNKKPPPPSLPDRIVAATRSRYVEAYETLTGRKFRG